MSVYPTIDLEKGIPAVTPDMTVEKCHHSAAIESHDHATTSSPVQTATIELHDHATTSFPVQTGVELDTATDSDEKPQPISPVLGWDRPDDPENPYNWSFGKRAYHTAATALLAFAVSAISRAYSMSMNH